MKIHRSLAGLLLLLACSSFAMAQRGSATGRLEVTATIISSSMWVEQPDGSFRLVVANAYGGQDVAKLQMAVNRAALAPSPDAVTVQLVPAEKAAHKHTHRR